MRVVDPLTYVGHVDLDVRIYTEQAVIPGKELPYCVKPIDSRTSVRGELPRLSGKRLDIHVQDLGQIQED
ncbi:hypothetical protein GCM10010399_85770 [Dactylosporangium fulvum]